MSTETLGAQNTISLLYSKLESLLLQMKWLFKFLSVCIVALILGFRYGDRLWYPQLWFEDGNAFLQDAYNLSIWESITKPHTTYYLTLNRILAEVALLFRLEFIPGLFVLMAFGVTVFCYSLFLLDRFRWLVPSVYLRAIFCFTLAALPATHEVTLLLLNIQWPLGILSFLLAMMQFPTNLTGRVIYVSGWLLLILSAPQAVLFLPCLAVRAFLFKEDRTIALLSCAAIIVGLLPMVWFNATVGGGFKEASLPPLKNLVTAFVNDFAMRVLVASSIGYIKSYQWFYQQPKAYLGYLWYIGYIFVNACILIPALRQRQRPLLLVWAYCTYTMISPVVIALIRSGQLVDFGQSMSTAFGGERYFILSIVALYFLVFYWLAKLPVRNLWINSLTVALCGVGLTAIILDFTNPFVGTDYQWLLQAQRIYHIKAGDVSRTIKIPANPSTYWSAKLHVQPAFNRTTDAITFVDRHAPGTFEFAGSETGNPIVTQDDVVQSRGWALNPDTTGAADEVIVLEKDTGMLLARTHTRVPRYDVAEVLGSQHHLQSGWQVSFPGDMLTLGSHTLRAYVLDKQTMQAFPINGEVTVQIDYARTEIVDNSQSASDRPIGYITPDRWIQQEFVARRDGLTGIAVKMATFGRQNSGVLTFYLQRLNAAGGSHLVASMSVDTATLQDNEDVLFRFDPIRMSKGQRYALVIASPGATDANAVTTWIQTGDPYPQGQLFQGGSPISADLTFKLVYESQS